MYRPVSSALVLSLLLLLVEARTPLSLQCPHVAAPSAPPDVVGIFGHASGSSRGNCFGNLVTNIDSLFSYSFYLSGGSGVGPSPASAKVYDTNTNPYTVVAQVSLDASQFAHIPSLASETFLPVTAT